MLTLFFHTIDKDHAVLQEKIHSKPKSKKVPRALRARRYFVRLALSKERRQVQYLYRIHPPVSRPFFPSDETLRSLLQTLPDVHFLRCTRTRQYDRLYVHTFKNNVFNARAKRIDREKHAAFMAELGAHCSEESVIPQHVVDACRVFLSANEFVSVEWDGIQLIAYNADGYRYEWRIFHTPVGYGKAFRALYRICRTERPFIFGTAPP